MASRLMVARFHEKRFVFDTLRVTKYSVASGGQMRIWRCTHDDLPRRYASDDGHLVREESLFDFRALLSGMESLATPAGRPRSFTDADAAMAAIDDAVPWVPPMSTSSSSPGIRRSRFPVAALYVDPKGLYGDMCEEVFDIERDAKTYESSSAKGLPIVAHPPCGPWGKLKGFCREQDPSTGPHAVDLVRRYGGVLEHPVGSTLFDHCGIPVGEWDNPDRPLDAFGGYTLRIRQFDFGHRGAKDTVFYIVGCADLPVLLDREDDVQIKVQNMSRLERRLTPDLMARWLCRVAASCVDGDAWRKHLFGRDV